MYGTSRGVRSPHGAVSSLGAGDRPCHRALWHPRPARHLSQGPALLTKQTEPSGAAHWCHLFSVPFLTHFVPNLIQFHSVSRPSRENCPHRKWPLSSHGPCSASLSVAPAVWRSRCWQREELGAEQAEWIGWGEGVGAGPRSCAGVGHTFRDSSAGQRAPEGNRQTCGGRGRSLWRLRRQEETGPRRRWRTAWSPLLVAVATGPSSALILYKDIHWNDERVCV